MESCGDLCSKQGLGGIEELILVSPCLRLVWVAALIYRHNMHRNLGKNVYYQEHFCMLNIFVLCKYEKFVIPL